MRKLRDKATEAFAKGRFSKAAEFYEEFCKGEPKDYQARLRMGDAWAKAGQKDRAISAYQLAATGFAREGFLPRAIAASKLILELDPAHKGVQQMLADLYARKSAGGNGVPQRPVARARQVELPTFTEHMATSMGPAAAPLELPEEDEAAPAPRAIIPPPPPEMQLAEYSRDLPPEMEIPVHAPLEIREEPPDDEEIAVVQGVPLTPAPVAPSAAHLALAQAQLTPTAPRAAVPPAPEPAARVQPPASVSPPPAPPVAEPAARAQPSAPAPEGAVSPVAEPVARAQPSASGPVVRAPQPPPTAPAAPAPQAVEPPRAAEPTAPSVPAAPPGLAPRAAAPRPPAVAPIASVEPPRQVPPAKPAEAAPAQRSQAASSEETALEVELGQGTKKLSWAALSEPLFPVASSVSQPPPQAPSVAPAPASSAPPGLRPRRSGESDLAVTPAPGHSAVVIPPSQTSRPSTAFTELELEEDTLLHAVEQAALSGMRQRAAASPAAALQEEEEEIILTEEAPSDAPSAEALPTIPLFSDLPREAFIDLFERCPLRHFAQRSRVFEQGSHGDAFYVICEGSVQVFRHEGGHRKELATLSSGAFFGEMALLSGAPRMASVESVSDDTQLLEISAPVLAELSRQHPQLARALKKFCRERMLSNVMGTSALFEPFGRKDRRALVEKFRAREVMKNDVIVREGENTDGLYVVLSGEVEARKGDQVLSRLKEGELFGEISLLSKTPATATVMATRRTSLLRLPREDFDALILTHPQILVLVSELSEQRLRRTEALTGNQVFEVTAEELLV
ncbi:MAG TPA: cyclic nucleotide-binding domain-containing protein [Hyalangium sp.]|nr:cyclic nucleotide-binding domain-containing protein [Hyalangium sp.]HYH97842.1 cyclic nucleotide-binding domain-containing protein [Hyalangium sp.]